VVLQKRGDDDPTEAFIYMEVPHWPVARRVVLAGIAALSLAAASIATVEPAQAFRGGGGGVFLRGGGGFGHGFGGFRGGYGGFRGGYGFRRFGYGGFGFRRFGYGGFGYRRFGYGYRRFWPGFGWGLGYGLAAAYPDYGYGYGPGYYGDGPAYAGDGYARRNGCAALRTRLEKRNCPAVY
jgi:hypothetical protein